MTKTRHDRELHNTRCHFRGGGPGRFSIYRLQDGSLYFSMLSPYDKVVSCHEFEGSYRLEADMSRTPLEDLDRPDDHRAQRASVQPLILLRRLTQGMGAITKNSPTGS